MAEEDIDNETLQAQIDLSLSFAQNLVSSWVKPSRNPTKSTSHALEAELKEYMRRPPRLGVGAAIPEVASASRETERLKAQLSGKGKKRTRGDEDDAGVKQPSDNEEESRGASIKKKARIDPFEAHGKKKKKDIDGAPEQKSVGKGKAVEKDAPVDSAQPPSPSKKSKKKKHKNRDRPHPPDADPETLPGPSKVPSTPSIPPSTPKISQEAIDISLITSPTPSPTTQRPKPVLKGPILNLGGPPTDDESDQDAARDGAPPSPKKKRKRKKKKHALLQAS